MGYIQFIFLSFWGKKVLNIWFTGISLQCFRLFVCFIVCFCLFFFCFCFSLAIERASTKPGRAPSFSESALGSSHRIYFGMLQWWSSVKTVYAQISFRSCGLWIGWSANLFQFIVLRLKEILKLQILLFGGF